MKHIIQQVAEQMGLSVASITGPGMFRGEECLGIKCETLMDFAQLMVDVGAAAAESLEIPEVKYYSLGRNTIYYFPTIKFEEEYLEEEEND